MRCVIARFPFDLFKADVETAMADVQPEAVTAACVVIDGRVFPAKQVGRIITGQDPRDFTAGEVTRALSRLGFTCHDAPPHVPSPAPSPAAASPWGI
jgi:hypothetical protein